MHLSVIRQCLIPISISVDLCSTAAILGISTHLPMRFRMRLVSGKKEKIVWCRALWWPMPVVIVGARATWPWWWPLNEKTLFVVPLSPTTLHAGFIRSDFWRRIYSQRMISAVEHLCSTLRNHSCETRVLTSHFASHSCLRQVWTVVIYNYFWAVIGQQMFTFKGRTF